MDSTCKGETRRFSEIFLDEQLQNKLNHINIHDNFDSQVLKILILKSRWKLFCNYKIFRYKNKI